MEIVDVVVEIEEINELVRVTTGARAGWVIVCLFCSNDCIISLGVLTAPFEECGNFRMPYSTPPIKASEIRNTMVSEGSLNIGGI